jgi:hypothetical protein
MPTNEAPPANTGIRIGSLLSGFGIKDAATRDDLENIITTELTELGLEAAVGGIRHDVLTLLTDPLNAALLRYDLDRLKVAINDRAATPIQSITVKTRRGPQ